MKKFLFILSFVLMAAFAYSDSEWQVSESIDEFTDAKQYIFSTEAVSGTNQYGRLPYFIVRINDDGCDIYIDWKTFISTSREVPLIVRFDSYDLVQVSSPTSSDFEATFFPDPFMALKAVLYGEKLVVKSFPYGANPIVSTFDLKGFRVLFDEKFKSTKSVDDSTS